MFSVGASYGWYLLLHAHHPDDASRGLIAPQRRRGRPAPEMPGMSLKHGARIRHLQPGVACTRTVSKGGVNATGVYQSQNLRYPALLQFATKCLGLACAIGAQPPESDGRQVSSPR